VATLHLTLTRRLATRTVTARITDLVIAGWTGRDPSRLEVHVRELEAIGIPRPSSTPLFYRVAADLLSQSTSIQVLGTDSTGEAEAVLLAVGGELCVGVGSDHTDRVLERVGVAAAKQSCAKPVGPVVWPLAEVAGHWGELVLKSYVTTRAARELYQEGTLDGLHEPEALIDRYAGKAGLSQGTAIFCGTLPVEGALRGGERFEVELIDPVLDRVLRHTYHVTELPIVC
jgi:hypothetical protein